jgi:hypothetical protein
MLIFIEKRCLLPRTSAPGDYHVFFPGDKVDIPDPSQIQEGYRRYEQMYPSEKTLTQNCILAGAFYPEGIMVYADQAAIDAGYKAYTKSLLRGALSDTAGDTAAILGTTTDATHLSLLLTVAGLASLATSDTFELFRKTVDSQVKQALKVNLTELGEKCQHFLTQVVDKKVVFPYTAKYPTERGVDSVFADVATRATSVAQTLTK